MHRRPRLISFLSLILLTASMLPADSPAEGPRDEYRKIQKELRKQEKKLESAKKAEVYTAKELRKTEGELQKVKADLVIRQERIGKVRARISFQETEIRRTLGVLVTEKRLLKERMRALHRAGRINDAVLIIVSGTDLNKALRIRRYLSDISAYDARLIARYKGTLGDLTAKQAGLKRAYAELKTEEEHLARTEGELERLRAEREDQLVSVRKEKRSYERMIQDLKEASGNLRRIIEESERKEQEARKKRPPGRKEPLEDSAFTRLKGSLAWPVSGRLGIPYGTQTDAVFNLPVFRSGVHIRTGDGASVKAVYEGKVVYADSFKGYGQLVIISHGNGYHTLYGNLSRIFCRNGGIIKNHQVIGEAGESAALGASGLYFEIRYKGKPLDPQQWLKAQ